MTITSAVYTDPDHQFARIVENGKVMDVPANANNRHWFAVLLAVSEGQLTVQPYQPPPPTLEQYDEAVQGHLDATAKARGYRDAATCISYISSTNATWAAEAAVFAPWRDAVWLYAFEQLALVQGGQRSQPTPAELVDELPAIEWP